MSSSVSNFDLWFVEPNQVYRGVPYTVVVDWIGQGRIGAQDRVRAAGSERRLSLAESPSFGTLLSKPIPRVEDAAEALEPIELDIDWKRPHEEEDDDVDMIPLIDISMVLLIFFMMTSAISSVSRVMVPETENAPTIDKDPNSLALEILIPAPGKSPEFALNGGNQPREEAGSEEELLSLLKARLEKKSGSAKVRIAAQGDLPWEIVERMIRGLDTLKNSGVNLEYSIETNPKKK